jgi:hypothetical protein
MFTVKREVSEFFFNTEAIEKHFPEFPWRTYQQYYFCTGAFFAKRGIFKLEEYTEILELANMHPETFPYGGEMGLLNFMLCRAAHEGRLRLGQSRMQTICADYSKYELCNMFPSICLDKKKSDFNCSYYSLAWEKTIL